MPEIGPPFSRVIPAFLAGCFVLGAAFGVAWALGAYRPGYVIGEDLSAHLSERGLAQVFASDALFAILMAFAGLAVGVIAWLLFRGLGWWVCVLAIVGAAIVALVAWQAGMLVGEHNFAERLAHADRGDVVPIDLQLRSLAAMLVAPFFASIPVMVLAAFWPEDRAWVAPDERVGEPAVDD